MVAIISYNFSQLGKTQTLILILWQPCANDNIKIFGFFDCIKIFQGFLNVADQVLLIDKVLTIQQYYALYK